jgi:hypothetical protein
MKSSSDYFPGKHSNLKRRGKHSATHIKTSMSVVLCYENNDPKSKHMFEFLLYSIEIICSLTH